MPRSRRRALLPLLVVVPVLGGCLETGSTRSCPAFDGHPELDDWAPYDVGDILTYAGDGGATQGYVLRSIEGSAPFETSEIGDTEDIRCGLEAAYRFEASDDDHALVQVFEVVDVVGEPRASSSLNVTLSALESVADVPRPPFPYTFFLTEVDVPDSANASSTDRYESSVSATREVGQVTYRDVIERTLFDSAVDRSTPPETTLTRVVFARGGGLVEFERSDGQTFTLVPP